MHNLSPISGLLGGATIGLASAPLMLFTGRIAGISGLFGGILLRTRLIGTGGLRSWPD